MNFKVQIVLVLIFFKKVSTNNQILQLNRLPRVPPNLSAYKYEGNYYPVYASKTINTNTALPAIVTKPQRFTRFLNPVHLSHQIYHDDNQQAVSSYNDATGSEYQVAMKVQPLQQVIRSGKTQAIEESGKFQPKRQFKVGIMSPPEEMQSLRKSSLKHGFANHKIHNELPLKSVPNVSRHYHDIFLKFKSPQELVFGHVLSWPELAQKRIEKKDNNHSKGQVIWADKTGGYGEHYWDLAQGAL